MTLGEPRELPCVAPHVSLFWCDLALAPADVERVAGALSAEERARATRFGTDALRARWIAGRVSLREILGSALAIAAPDVPLARGMRGRPELKGFDRELDFNVSHTGAVALIALLRTEGRPVRIGVDIERKDRPVGSDRLARKFLTSAERASIAPATPDEHHRRFLRYWTCKEAMSKATGDGLVAPFRQIDIELDPLPRLIDGPAPYRPPAWTLLAAPVPDDHFATIALWERA
jgi:4'-phosphopantetheinyl transferase